MKTYLEQAQVGYFSMEIGLHPDIPTYSGGLGILAGDTLKSFADLGTPVVGVTLLYKKGYFKQLISEHGQIEAITEWEPNKLLQKLPETIEIAISGRIIKVGAWVYPLKGISGHIVPVIFLDTDLPENHHEYDRNITAQLYSGDNHHRLVQEIILGIGGAKMLEALGIKPKLYHLNEGHAAFLTLELLAKNNWDDEAVRKLCVFTTHTPVPAGHDEFPYDLAYKVMGHYLPWHIKDLAGQEKLNMTILALSLSRFANGVAQKHGEVSRNMFPGFSIDAITNGVHTKTWTSPSFAELYEKYIPGWQRNPESLRHAQVLPDQEVWNAHQKEKQKLLEKVKEISGIEMSPDILTIGFARRAATYKRGDLLFTDTERLLQICQGKVQFIFAGKAHPHDHPGKEIIKRILQQSKKLKEKGLTIVFLPNYEIELAKLLTAGCDVWLNTPMRPREASGTSGMKAAHNGVPNFSVLDGWWIEGWQEGITGWAIGPEATEQNLVEVDNLADATDLYNKLEKIIIPLYYNDRSAWITIMKNAISRNANYFNTHRMCKEYLIKAYQLNKTAVPAETTLRL